MLYYIRQEGKGMSKKVKTPKPREQWQVIASQRRDWENINPVTRVIPDKRNKKPKHKKGWDEE